MIGAIGLSILIAVKMSDLTEMENSGEEPFRWLNNTFTAIPPSSFQASERMKEH